MQPQPEALTWKVGVQNLTQVDAGSGRYAPAWVVPFTLSNGVTDSVTVPVADYNPANVRAAIEAKAATHAQVANLSGTVVPGMMAQ